MKTRPPLRLLAHFLPAAGLFAIRAFAADPPPLSLSVDQNSATLAFQAATVGSHRVQCSTNLQEWLFTGQSIMGQGQFVALTYPVEGERQFWRVRAYEPDAAYDSGTLLLELAPTIDQVWTDGTRSYDMPVRIVSPALRAGDGPFPVIILSHGLAGNRSAFDSLASYLAARGAICVTLTHEDSRPRSRIERPADVSFALDVILSANPPSPLIANRVDPAKVGMIGHSFGAFTTLAIMGASYGETDEPGAPLVHPADLRVVAGIPLSPQGPGILGLTESSWDAIDRPVLTLRGSEDTSFETPDPATRDLPYRHMPPQDKYLGVVAGAVHSDFSDNGIAEHGDTFTQWYFPAIAAFLDAQLHGDTVARDWLDSQAINRLSGQVLVLEGK